MSFDSHIILILGSVPDFLTNNPNGVIYDTQILKDNTILLRVLTNDEKYSESVFINKSTGEIAVFSMVKFRKYFVKIFQQWRGEKMLANDRSTWVANDAELIEAIKSLSSLNIKFEEGKK